MRKRLRVLISAYACEPDKGSEPAVGWNWVSQIARHHEVWVLTRANNRNAIENACAAGQLQNVHWNYFDLPRWAQFWKRGRRGIHLYYYLWQLGALFVARKLQRRVKYDIAHHVTFVSYSVPSFLAFLPVPFIWGPVGGGEALPLKLWRNLPLKARTYEFIRWLAHRLCEHDPFLRWTARRAAIALATTEETAERLRALGCRRVEILSQVALPQDEIDSLARITPRATGPFRVLSIGSLLHLKGFDLALRAFASLQSDFRDSQYWILGDGPERDRLESLARSLGLQGRVRFWGQVPRHLVLQRLADCDVLLHPALHDSGSYVCAEAMAAGRAVICLDLGGPALQVSDSSGRRVRPTDRDGTVRSLASSLVTFASDAEARSRAGQAGREIVRRDLCWENKGAHARLLYRRVLGDGRPSENSGREFHGSEKPSRLATRF